MNWQHFQTFAWLRWRILRNQWRRAGAVNAVLMMIVVVVAILGVIPLFLGSIVLGVYAIPKASPVHLLYACDAIVLAFLFFWSIGLITELQRSDPLTLSKFLHLPVSANSAFVINYLSSLLRLSLIVFGPVLLAFSLALVWTKGIVFLPVLPALAAFFLDGHGPDLSISRMAGVADEQPAPASHRGRDHDDRVRPDLSITEFDQLYRAVASREPR